jgi:hypothetical protein
LGRLRYIEIHHKYVVPMQPEALDLPDYDALCNSGISIMENHMQRLNPNIRDLVTSWETMPSSYEPIEETPQTGTVHRGRVPTESELIRMQVTGVNFVDDVMGGVGDVVPPHEEGLRMFPSGHPLHDAESEILEMGPMREEPKQIEDATIVREEDIEDDGDEIDFEPKP